MGLQCYILFGKLIKTGKESDTKLLQKILSSTRQMGRMWKLGPFCNWRQDFLTLIERPEVVATCQLALWDSIVRFGMISARVDFFYFSALKFCPWNKNHGQGLLRHGSWRGASFFPSSRSKSSSFGDQKFKESFVSMTLLVTNMSCESFVTLLAPLDVAGALVYSRWRSGFDCQEQGWECLYEKILFTEGFLAVLSPSKWRKVIKEETCAWGCDGGAHWKFIKTLLQQFVGRHKCLQTQNKLWILNLPHLSFPKWYTFLFENLLGWRDKGPEGKQP